MKRKVFFRADGGVTTGLGHIVRSCALADMLKDHFECHFLVREPSAALQQLILSSCMTVQELPDNISFEEEALNWSKSLSGEEIVVLDGYHFTAAYQQYIKDCGCKLVCIDDIFNTHFVADAVINHAPGITIGDYQVALYTRVLLGVGYVLLREPFLQAVKHRKERQKLDSLFVCFGGSDFNNFTGKTLDAAVLSGKITTIHLVTGNAFQHKAALEEKIATYQRKGAVQISLHNNVSAAELAHIIAKCDIAVCPCSSILLEASAVGAGLISGFYVDNQKHIFEFLDRSGIFAGVGDFNTIGAAGLAQKIREMTLEQVNQQISLQSQLIDGRSSQRLQKLFYKLEKEYNIKERPAALTDTELLYQWANDPETRANAINTAPIPWEDHVQWFNKKVTDNNSRIFIFEQLLNSRPVGMVRFDYQDERYLISYLVDKDVRGEGWGEIILKRGIIALTGSIDRRPLLKAMVKEGNIASMQVFVNLGFTDKAPVEMNNISYKVYEKE